MTTPINPGSGFYQYTCAVCGKGEYEQECSWKQNCDACSKHLCSEHRYEFDEYDDGSLCEECLPICMMDGCFEKATSILRSASACTYCNMYELCGGHGIIIYCPCGTVCRQCTGQHVNAKPTWPTISERRNHNSSCIYDEKHVDRIYSIYMQGGIDLTAN